MLSSGFGAEIWVMPRSRWQVREGNLGAVWVSWSTQLGVVFGVGQRDAHAKLKENQIVIMDNASIHKSSKIREVIEKVGCCFV